MENKHIHDLIKLVSKLGVSEVKLERGDFKITIKTELAAKGFSTAQAMAMPMAVTSTQPSAEPAAVVAADDKAQSEEPSAPQKEALEESKYVQIKSPMIGTFYRSSSPDKDVFVKVGDRVNEGDVVCIVEAMKLFNEIESEVSGTIVKVMVDNASPIEYDQVLFLVDPS